MTLQVSCGKWRRGTARAGIPCYGEVVLKLDMTPRTQRSGIVVLKSDVTPHGKLSG